MHHAHPNHPPLNSKSDVLLNPPPPSAPDPPPTPSRPLRPSVPPIEFQTGSRIQSLCRPTVTPSNNRKKTAPAHPSVHQTQTAKTTHKIGHTRNTRSKSQWFTHIKNRRRHSRSNSQRLAHFPRPFRHSRSSH